MRHPVRDTTRPPTRGRVWRLCGLALGLALTPGGLGAQTGRSEYEVKAAVLFNVIRFVEWPEAAFADPADPIIVAVAGTDPFGPILERTLAGRLVHGRPLTVRRFRKPREIDFCHVLFVAAGEDPDAWLEFLRLSQVGGALTVGEEEAFARSGGALTLRVVRRHVRFEIDPEAARADGLKISSRLLALARVEGQP